MKQMHDFKEAQREAIPAPDFRERVTLKLLLQFLCDLCTWARAVPDTIAQDADDRYLLFDDVVFSEQDFWQTFGGYLIALRPRWQISVFGTQPATQETVALSLDRQKDGCYAVQQTVSGRYAGSIRSLCLQIVCADAEQAAALDRLCRCMDWKSGVIAAGWDLHAVFEREGIPWLRRNTCYCYGNITAEQTGQTWLDALSFPQKTELWRRYLETGLDYVEFAWLYDGISRRELNRRTEWELALYTALNRLQYTLRLSESEFELYDGRGERRYFSVDSEQNAQRAFLKLLFPVNA